MGYIRHNAIVVTTSSDGLIEAAAKKARDLGAQVLGPSDSVVNGYRSILICADGSKEGWDDSSQGDARREAFKAWLRQQAFSDGSSSLEWVEVSYGNDDLSAAVVDDQWRNRASGVALADPADKLRRCSLGCFDYGQCKANMHGTPSECASGVAVGPTGREPELLQDCDRKLSRALASTPDARLHAREAAATAGVAEVQAPSRHLALDRYDAGLLGGMEGMSAEWWQDYIRAELARAHDFYQQQADNFTAGVPVDGTVTDVHEQVRLWVRAKGTILLRAEVAELVRLAHGVRVPAKDQRPMIEIARELLADPEFAQIMRNLKDGPIDGVPAFDPTQPCDMERMRRGERFGWGGVPTMCMRCKNPHHACDGGGVMASDASRPFTGALNDVPATLTHDEGAYAQCGECGRYTLNPNALTDRPPPCDCGSRHGWSGSFKRPGPAAKWSGLIQPAASGVPGTPALTDEQIVQLAIKAGLDEEMWFGPHTPPSAKDCLPELRKFAELVRALGVAVDRHQTFSQQTPMDSGKG